MRPSRPRTVARLVVAAGTLVAGGVLAAGAASAHIDPDPPAVQAGTAASIDFGVEHGCNGSSTTKLEMKIPAGITDAKAADKAGWTSTVANGVVTWTGGPLDAATKDTFTLTFTAPTTPDTYRFPIVQTCQTGSLQWIEVAVDGQPEPEHPAPALLVTKDKPTAEQLAPPADDAGTADAGGATTVAGGSTGAGATTAPAVIAPAPTTAAATSDSSSNTGAIVGGIIAAVVVLGGAAYALTRKKAGSPPAN